MRVIDLEAHYYPPSLIEHLSRRDDYPKYDPETFHIQFRDNFFVKNPNILSKLYASLESRVACMDAFGIDTQALSISAGVELLEDAESIEYARAANDFVYEAMKRYPGRFLGFASLPVNAPKEAAAELKRCMQELGFLGWNTFSNFGPTSPDQEQYRPIWDAAAQLNAPVYLHPSEPYYGRFHGLGPQLSAAALGFGVDTSITLMRLVFSGMLDDNPGLKIILGHLGEALPFTLERMDGRCKLDIGPPAKNRYLPSHYFKNNIYVTTSGQYSLAAFACAKEVLGMDHIMFATDYPYETPEEVREFRQKLQLSQAEEECFYHKNAEEVLGIKI